MLKLLQEISQVSAKVKLELLKNYVKACRFKHSLAFIQWRLLFSKIRKENKSTTQMDDSEVEEIIQYRFEILKNRAET